MRASQSTADDNLQEIKHISTFSIDDDNKVKNWAVASTAFNSGSFAHNSTQWHQNTTHLKVTSDGHGLTNQNSATHTKGDLNDWYICDCNNDEFNEMLDELSAAQKVKSVLSQFSSDQIAIEKFISFIHERPAVLKQMEVLIKRLTSDKEEDSLRDNNKFLAVNQLLARTSTTSNQSEVIREINDVVSLLEISKTPLFEHLQAKKAELQGEFIEHYLSTEHACMPFSVLKFNQLRSESAACLGLAAYKMPNHPLVVSRQKNTVSKKVTLTNLLKKERQMSCELTQKDCQDFTNCIKSLATIETLSKELAGDWALQIKCYIGSQKTPQDFVLLSELLQTAPDELVSIIKALEYAACSDEGKQVFQQPIPLQQLQSELFKLLTDKLSQHYQRSSTACVVKNTPTLQKLNGLHLCYQSATGALEELSYSNLKQLKLTKIQSPNDIKIFHQVIINTQDSKELASIIKELKDIKHRSSPIKICIFLVEKQLIRIQPSGQNENVLLQKGNRADELASALTKKACLCSSTSQLISIIHQVHLISPCQVKIYPLNKAIYFCTRKILVKLLSQSEIKMAEFHNLKLLDDSYIDSFCDLLAFTLENSHDFVEIYKTWRLFSDAGSAWYTEEAHFKWEKKLLDTMELVLKKAEVKSRFESWLNSCGHEQLINLKEENSKVAQFLDVIHMKPPISTKQQTSYLATKSAPIKAVTPISHDTSKTKREMLENIDKYIKYQSWETIKSELENNTKMQHLFLQVLFLPPSDEMMKYCNFLIEYTKFKSICAYLAVGTDDRIAMANVLSSIDTRLSGEFSKNKQAELYSVFSQITQTVLFDIIEIKIFFETLKLQLNAEQKEDSLNNARILWNDTLCSYLEGIETNA